MKTLEIKIKSRAQADAEFAEAFKAARSGKKPASKGGIYFTSLKAVRALLTDKRLNLLHLIKEKSPRSINELAKIAGRDFKNVYADVMLLKSHGLIQISKRKKARTTARKSISVPFQAINIQAFV